MIAQGQCRKKNIPFLRDWPRKKNLFKKQGKMNERPYSERLQNLAHQYLRGELNRKEQQEVDEWFQSEEGADFIESHMSKDEYRNLLLQRIHNKAGIVNNKRPTQLYVRVAVAASLILTTMFVAYLVPKKSPVKQQVSQAVVGQIQPGGNKAVLILDDGSNINLTSGKQGLLVRQGSVKINKTNSGSLSYTSDSASDIKEPILYNTVVTPRGGKYRLTLSDGTIAILDAASSIRFPVAFDKERKVSITGQVYFEVVHNVNSPFLVSVKGQLVKDLGTKFNINAYDDEPVIKTTLLEGGISLTRGSQTAVLKPGQQAINAIGNPAIKIIDADIDESVAWKNDFFQFEDEPLESVMRKISRWYDVDVVYQKGSDIHESYLGRITRYSEVSKVLKMLEVTGDVQFEIQGRTIKVFSKIQTNQK
ncbi:FecR family protein [Chitinophaga filiformis]|uniref:DUF4974 domain-containing protein n=1 Tax=Chitinophaga filiformis TaxID=104663 RepID=A0ABY4HYX5_CHIFI|nr:FecR family protein [Chitinophaga filiformis]UPK69021.1 DUF4974 domain-containing protein [Chitinophaga filiformis]